MECQKYRDKYCGNCVRHHTYKETAVELQHFKTNHSPTTRSISEAPALQTLKLHPKKDPAKETVKKIPRSPTGFRM